VSASLEQIRAAIGAVMNAVPNIGIVHPYERYAKREPDLATLYFWSADDHPRQLRGWIIRRVATRELDHSTAKTRVEVDWEIRGWMSLVDETQSEIVMDGLVEELRNAFRRDPTLGGLLDAPIVAGQPVGPQLVESQPYMFAGILCHGVRLTLTTAYLQSLAADSAGLDDFEVFHANWDVRPFAGITSIPADDTADATDTVTLETSP